MLRQLEMGEDLGAAVDTVNKKIDSLNKRKSKLLELVTEGNISNKSFGEMNKQIEEEILELERELAEIGEKQESREEYR